MVLFLFSPLVAQTITSVSAHYYLYETTDEDGDSLACGIEIHSEDVEDPPGPPFVEVTLAELHQKGYLTAQEQSDRCPPPYKDSISPTPGRSGISWIHLYWGTRDPQALYCYSGSRTRTSSIEYIRVEGRRRKYNKATGELLSTRHAARVDLNGPEVDVWWRTKHNPNVYNPPKYYRWNQHGWHQWRAAQV